MPVSLLGPLEITNSDGDVIGPLSHHQRRLLGALAVYAGQVVEAERLVHMVWDEHELPDGGVKALQTRISRLRPVLSEAGMWLETRGPGYVLHRGPDDVIVFEDVLASARNETDPDVAVIQFDEALALWRGRPFDDVADLEWARTEVTRLQELHASAIEHRFKAMLASGRHTEAIAPIRDAIAAGPWRDRLRGQLALALYRAGRQTEALRSLDHYRRSLRSETGLDLGPELRSLEARILDQDPDLLFQSELQTQRGGVNLEEVIGEGSMAVVWRGTQPGLDRPVAIKVIRPELANDPDFVRRFEFEAQTVSRLEHPHVAPLYDFWREPGGAYLVMRYLSGGGLDERIRGTGLEPEELERLIEHVGHALRAAHQSGIVHGDVKPANILLDEDGNYYLSDFGIARSGGATHTGSERRADGSPAYASPEQLTGRPVDCRSDIYSLGITLFEAATGRLPFQAGHAPGLVERQILDPVPAPSTIRRELPIWVDRVVGRATHKAAAERYQFLDDLLGDLPAPIGPVRDEYQLGESLRNPYKGLAAFGEADVNDFFGRDDLVHTLASALERPGPAGRLVALVGPSGAGKSSALRAGLIPALRSGMVRGSERWFITTMVPGVDAFVSASAALSRVARRSSGALAISDGPSLLRAMSAAVDDADAGTELLVVIDQFEELFTRNDPEVGQAFLDAMIVAVDQPELRVRFVVTVRADFWDRPLGHTGFARRVESQSISIGALGPEEMEAAITTGVERQGMRFESGLVARLMADAAGEQGVLPLLQFVLTELFEANSHGLIRSATYAEIGGIGGALGRRAESVFETMSEREQAATRRLFGRLVIQDGGETAKRRILRDELAADRDGQECIDRLAAARLLTLGRDASSRRPTVEMAHEALLGSWARLGAWVEADRDLLRTHRHLTNAAMEWDRAGRPSTELYRGGRLETAVELRRAQPNSLNDIEVSFLDASIDAEQQRAAIDRRRTRTLQGFLAGTAVLLAVALVAGLVAWQQRNQATTARTEAEQNATEALANSAAATQARRDAEDQQQTAETARLSAEAVTLAETDSQLAYLLAVEAYRRDPGPATLGAIQRVALRTGGVTQYLGSADKSYRDVRWADDDTIVGAHLGGIEVFSSATSELLMSLDLDVRTEIGNRGPGEGEIVAFDVSPNGRWAAVGSVSSTVEILDLGTGESISVAHPEPVSALAFPTDSARLATGDAAGTVRLWDLTDGSMLAEVSAHPEAALDLIDEVEAAGGTLEHLIEGPVVDSYGYRGVTRLVFSPEGQELVTTEFPMVRVWNARTLEPLRQFVPIDGGPNASEFGNPQIVPTDPADSLLAFDPIESAHIWLSNGNNVLHRYDTLTGALVESSSVETGMSGTTASAPGIVRTGDGHWLNLVDDGRLLDAPDDGEVAELAVAQLPRPSAIAIDNSERLIAGAADGGLFIVPRYGGSALSVGARRLGGNWLTITGDGELVAESQDPSGPTHFYRRNGRNYESAAASEPLTNEAIEIHTTPEGEVLIAAVRFEPDDGAAYELYRPANPSTFVRTPGIGLPDQAFHPNGRWTFLFPVFAGQSLAPVIWDIENDRPIAELDPFPEPEGWALFGRSAAFSADGTRVIATTTEGIYRIWDTDTWELEIDGLDMGPVVAADYDPTGTYLATIDPEGVLTLRSATNLEPIRRILLPGPIDLLWAGGIEWSSDGRVMLVAATAAPTLWDVESGAQIGNPFPSAQGSTPGAESGESIQLATTSADSIDIWNLDLDSWPTAACVAAGRNMTPDEWETLGPRDTDYRATCPQFGHQR